MCATFGAGLSSACVVDMGDEKTHICCVEDGISNPNTRYLHIRNTLYVETASLQDYITLWWK